MLLGFKMSDFWGHCDSFVLISSKHFKTVLTGFEMFVFFIVRQHIDEIAFLK